MKTKDQIIGVGIFFSDVCQQNEHREDRKKEKCGKRKPGNQGANKRTRLPGYFQSAASQFEGQLVLRVVRDPVFINGFLKTVNRIAAKQRSEKLLFLSHPSEKACCLDIPEIAARVMHNQGIPSVAVLFYSSAQIY